MHRMLESANYKREVLRIARAFWFAARLLRAFFLVFAHMPFVTHRAAQPAILNIGVTKVFIKITPRGLSFERHRGVIRPRNWNTLVLFSGG